MTVHVDAAGTGPALLMLHGIGGSADSFAEQFRGIHGLRLIAWDAPGYARSADPGDAPGADGYVDAAAQVLTEHAGEGGAHVLGMSWGGTIAIGLALKYPHLVRSLMLGDSLVGSGVTAEKADAMRARGAELDELGAQRFAERRARRLLAPGASEDAVATAAARMAESVRLPGYRWAAEALAATDHTADLPRITAPTLVLCGDEDRVTGRDASQILAGGIPDAVFVTVRGAGHLANQEQPEAFNAWIESFVQITERLMTR
ncbi:alpha/beta fold hydrolase [Tsukamurella sp. 1534]|uniref:alpha/beta fold hydrolase n=1 Tax=Tsukamurella sp. 1534 TaxID=1151061 RepID=UPI0002D50C77|nr:alpha/beta hydrolase [Tsukamurella sp. 1534]